MTIGERVKTINAPGEHIPNLGPFEANHTLVVCAVVTIQNDAI